METELEAIVDKVGVCGSLNMLCGICHDKAIHVRENWQDETLGRHWDTLARIVGKAATSAERLG